jgi:regulator of cell morphogenesis and NO signaling
MHPEGWNRSLGDLVAEVPGRAAVFDRLGLDYCCHGQRLLSDACAAAGLHVESVSDLIDMAGHPGADGADMAGDPVALVEDILVHHRYLRDEMPALVALAGKVVGIHGGRHRELVQLQELVTALWAELEPHLDAEETVLFPAICRLQGGERDLMYGPVRTLIREMTTQHERAGDLLAALRETSQGYTTPPDGCASYQSLNDRLSDLATDTHLHIHKENNVLFPSIGALPPVG